jgi:hypothetical protein
MPVLPATIALSVTVVVDHIVQMHNLLDNFTRRRARRPTQSIDGTATVACDKPRAIASGAPGVRDDSPTPALRANLQSRVVSAEALREEVVRKYR